MVEDVRGLIECGIELKLGRMGLNEDDEERKGLERGVGSYRYIPKRYPYDGTGQ
jgi:hypothetical protein